MQTTPRTTLAAIVLLTMGIAPALPLAPARADVDGPALVSYLNAQRQANGVPAGIVEDPALSDGCAQHVAYIAANGGVLTHDESESAPGYTPEGAAAAQNSVLYKGSRWTATANPFEEAPIHLHQLLAPRLDRSGGAERNTLGCLQTLASRNRPAPVRNVTYTYPGNGRSGWPTQQTAREGPYTPGEKLGLAKGTTTGPYLYAMFDGPNLTPFSEAHVTSATLSGPAGPVELLVADNRTPGLGGYLPPG